MIFPFAFFPYQIPKSRIRTGFWAFFPCALSVLHNVRHKAEVMFHQFAFRGFVAAAKPGQARPLLGSRQRARERTGTRHMQDEKEKTGKHTGQKSSQHSSIPPHLIPGLPGDTSILCGPRLVWCQSRKMFLPNGPAASRPFSQNRRQITQIDKTSFCPCQ